jgi:hypothetical protein
MLPDICFTAYTIRFKQEMRELWRSEHMPQFWQFGTSLSPRITGVAVRRQACSEPTSYSGRKCASSDTRELRKVTSRMWPRCHLVLGEAVLRMIASKVGPRLDKYTAICHTRGRHLDLRCILHVVGEWRPCRVQLESGSFLLWLQTGARFMWGSAGAQIWKRLIRQVE